jgi:hypothetical protein
MYTDMKIFLVDAWDCCKNTTVVVNMVNFFLGLSDFLRPSPLLPALQIVSQLRGKKRICRCHYSCCVTRKSLTSYSQLLFSIQGSEDICFEKSSFVEKMENLPGESNKVRINADMCKLNGKSAKNIARKSGKHKRSKNPPNWIRKGSVVFIRSQRDPPTHNLAKCAMGNGI